MNLSTTVWFCINDPIATNPTERLFLNSFHEFDLEQCIYTPTHNKGRILDLILTHSSPLLHNLKVHDKTSICKSDHFPICFDIKAKISYKKCPKRKIFNFKKADWEGLNKDISSISWANLMQSAEPELAWRVLRDILLNLISKHIPTITIKLGYKSPWFDSETHHSYLKKKRSHEKWKGSNDDLDYIKLSKNRSDFKQLSNKELNDNLYSFIRI